MNILRCIKFLEYCNGYERLLEIYYKLSLCVQASNLHIYIGSINIDKHSVIKSTYN